MCIRDSAITRPRYPAWRVGIRAGKRDGFLRPFFLSLIHIYTASIKTGLHDAIEQMPGFVKNALDAYDLGSPDAIVDSLGDTLSGNVDAVAQTISDKVIRPVAVLLLQMVCFFV